MTKSALETLIENEMAKEFNRGLREARSIDLGESSFGATRSAVVAIEFKKLSEIKNEIRDRRWRREGDNPGQAYLGSCELIHIYSGDYGKVGLLLCSTSYDI